MLGPALLLAAAAFGALCSSAANLSDVDTDIGNAYKVSLRISRIDSAPLKAVFIRFDDGNSTVFPYNVTGNGTFTAMFHDEVPKSLGIFENKDQLMRSNVVFEIMTNATGISIALAKVNLSEQITGHFPDVSSFDPFKLWPSQLYEGNLSINGMVVLYKVTFDGVTDVLGVGLKAPLWKVISIIAGIKFGMAFVFASLDFCRQPAHLLSSAGLQIFFGNLFWLSLGGLSVGIWYWIVGLILIITIILSPLGIKLIKFGTFALFPFGREIKRDEERREVLSLIGNLIWLFLIGIPIAIGHALIGIILCVLIITIPFGLKHLKLAKLAVMPFGHSVVFKNDLGTTYPSERLPLHQETHSPRYV